MNAAAPITGGISCPPTEPCELVVIAGFFHKRDREGTGRNNDGYGRTVDHSEKSGSNDCYLCRAALCAARDGVCEVVEELTHATLVHDFTEGNEEEDVGGRDVDRRSVNTFRVREEVAH